ncbi:unnamed protein product [Cylicocyclus nassatus]|uniref:Mutator-like transposase domain-containing protein n=1 Tax=Cylicocyclus nassatus TaxID=53992 RepID=A0AA36GWL1_CYLNA|nr:unnamed protein product [Cylicocyclus nassatus]
MFSSVAQELLQLYFASFKQTQKFLCVTHFINTAQSLLSETTLNGGRLCRRRDGTYYLDAQEIPAELLHSLNTAITFFADDIVVSSVEVNNYLNFYMKRFFNSKGYWTVPPSHQEAVAELEAIMEEPQEEAVEPPTPGRAHENVEQSPFNTPLLKKGDSTSSKATTGSLYSPGRDESSDSEDDEEEDQLLLKETDPHLLDAYFLVQGKKLLELLQINMSGSENNAKRMRLTRKASCPIIVYVTEGPRPEKKRWEGQDKLSARKNDKQFVGNILTCTAAVTTGVRMNKLIQWAGEFGLALPSQSTFNRIFYEMRPSINTVYQKHQDSTLQRIKAAYEREGEPTPWDIAVDGAYDSRGFSAEFCKVLAVDMKTKLCIHTEVVERRQTGGKSGLMEKLGFHNMLRWFRSQRIPIRSVSTDRNLMYQKEIGDYNTEFGENVRWYLDPWHLARRLEKQLRAASMRSQCESIRDWADDLKTHLYIAIKEGAEAGSGDRIKHVFNSCLKHVADVHEWTEDSNTGPVKKCLHKPIAPNEERGKRTISTGSVAHEKLKEIVLQSTFQNDIMIASPYGDTSQCETKNSVDRLYCPKELFLPRTTYPLYVKMATLHLNALREAELNGERVVESRTRIKRKFKERTSELKKKTPIQHLWRKEVHLSYVSTKLSRQTSYGEMMDTT